LGQFFYKMIKISTPPDFSFSECLWFLDRGFDEIMHEVTANSVRKLFEFSGQKVLIEVSQDDKELNVEVLAGELKDEELVISKVKEWFDLDREMQPFYELLAKDNDLHVLAKNYTGLRLMAIPDLFEVMCWSIIGQQINLTFAYKIKRALVEQFGESLTYKDKLYYLFPKPEVLCEVNEDLLREMKFSRQKIDYTINLAKSFAEGKLSLELIKQKETHNEMLKFLTSFRGIGEWTAQYTLMKCLKSPEAVPYGDAGINQALFGLKNIPKKGGRAEQEVLYARFKGWEGYLTLYLWRWLSEGIFTKSSEK
jgi:DNA-3-methyladenine glycosylase II